MTVNYLMFSILGGTSQIGGSQTKHNEHFSDINTSSHVISIIIKVYFTWSPAKGYSCRTLQYIEIINIH